MTFIYYLERNNKPFYIGKTKNPIRRKHKHHTIFGTDILLNVIDSCEDSREIWKYWERFYIELFISWGFNLVNKNKGGGGPTRYSEEQKIKMRKPRKKGTGQKISKTLRKNNHSKYYTFEIKSKISKALRGRKIKFSEAHKVSLAKAALLRGKTIYCYDLDNNFIKQFNCLREAGKWITDKQNLGKNNIEKQIKDCCLGKQKTCRNYIWRYKDQDIINTNFDYQNHIIYQFDKNKNLLNSYNFESLLEWLKLLYSNMNTCYVKRYKIFKLGEQNILNKINGYYWNFKNNLNNINE